MDTILLTILILLLVATLAILYLNIRSKPRSDSKEVEEIANLNNEIVRLKDSLNTTINTSLGSMSTSFNALSTGVTKDMTEALTKVDEKVGNFNQQVQLLNQSQEGITKIPITNIIFKIRYNSIKKHYNTTYESWTQFY